MRDRECMCPDVRERKENRVAIKHVGFAFNERGIVNFFSLLHVIVELYYRSFLTCDIIDRLLIRS